MNNSSLQKDLIQQGQYPLKVIKENGAISRLQPIEDVYPIQFFDFVKGKTKRFNLEQYLTKDFKVINLDFDLPNDDNQVLEDSIDRPENNTIYVEIRAFEAGNLKKEYYYTITTKKVLLADIYINHNHQWQIKCSNDIKALTFYCLPVYLNQPINITGV